MRNIYLTVAILFILSVALFIGAFIYLDKEGHHTYHYIINVDGRDIATVKVERFATEDKTLYKTQMDTPFGPVFQGARSKMVLDRNRNLSGYLRERFGNGAGDTIYLEINEEKGGVSFVSIFQSEFVFIDNIPVKKRTSVFEEEMPTSYLPLIEGYDFRKGRSQGFNILELFSESLPPAKRFAVLTSIRDEYLELDSRKMKAEHLILKMRNYPQSSIWVAKSDRSLLMVEMPEKGIRIRRAFSEKTLDAKEPPESQEGYLSKDVVFKNKSIELSGTMTVPNGEGPFPAILLIWDEGPQDRDYQGFFASFAAHLSRGGFAVLRFDKRGIGSSRGDYSSTTDTNIMNDLKAGLDFLAGQKEVDTGRISAVGHGRGALYAARLAAETNRINAVIMLAPSGLRQMDLNTYTDILRRMASRFGWSEDYLKLAIKAHKTTLDKAASAKGNWVLVARKRAFAKKIKEGMDLNPGGIIKDLNVPVLVLQNKEDEYLSLDTASTIDNMLAIEEKKPHAVVYFSYLNHFFGKRINDGEHKIYYEIDKDVANSMMGWLNKQSLKNVEEDQPK